MDAVRIEHDFAYALGIELGLRGKANDADGVRASKVEYLKRAVSEACTALRVRLSTVDDQVLNQELGFAIEALEETYCSLEPAGIDKTPACLALWSAAALSMRLMAKVIDQQDV